MIEDIIEAERPYAGPGNFDEPNLRGTGRRSGQRRCREPDRPLPLDGNGPADARLNRLEGVPTLVVHGTADPSFPAAHGSALAEVIPGLG